MHDLLLSVLFLSIPRSSLSFSSAPLNSSWSLVSSNLINQLCGDYLLPLGQVQTPNFHEPNLIRIKADPNYFVWPN